MLPEQTVSTISLMITFAINIFEGMCIGFFFQSFESQRVCLKVSFATLCYFSVVFEFVQSITFLTLRSMYIACISCYNIKSLELDKRTKLLYQSKTQENLIKSFIQSKLSYIPIQMVCANYCAPYPKQLCTRHEVNMWYTCCMMLLLLKPSTSFFHIL